ncbi:MAG: AAA family ATPase [Sulfuricella sp.]|nr:AAA family ATPase [Sulfuricella sp.]
MSTRKTAKSLQPGQLYHRCDPAQFKFKTTEELADPADISVQARAEGAVRFGIGMRRDGYNLFAFGPAGVGKHTLVRGYLENQASREPTPSDWCYVNNFEQIHRPRALQLPPGRGMALRRDMEQLVEDLSSVIPSAFESEDYRTRKQVIESDLKECQEGAFAELQQRAEARGIALVRTPEGFAFGPLRAGKVLGPAEFEKLPDAERQRVEAEVAEFEEQLRALLRQFPQLEKEMRQKIKALNREVAIYAVGHLIDTLRQKYADLDAVVAYFDAVQQDVVVNVQDFLHSGEGAAALVDAAHGAANSPSFRRYRVNVLVDRDAEAGAPVIYEDNPNYGNLIGRVEHISQMGTLVTDFNLIKSGALHRACGGYLMLDAHKLLSQPFAWDGLKRTLRSGQINIESLGQALSLVSTVSLEPEAIPLNVKVVLLGEPYLYYLLSHYDPEFHELFKVEADFSDDMPRSPDNHLLYARLIASLARREKLLPFKRNAVARIIEHSARLAGDGEKLSTHMGDLADLLREADYWAAQVGQKAVAAEDVQRAIDARVYRSDRVRNLIHEEILRGTVLIETEGTKVGQVNGLSVIGLNHFSFGRPSKITARVWLGKGDVVDIEREVELGGPIHSKGVMILTAFLGARYAAEHPLTLSASLVFEQSYGGVEGDSASSAELYTLLSALADVPLKQSLAVTGSVNQHGVVQAIGGVNEKIEGFFDVCRARGLTGEQGVLIPAANVKHLMLRHDVVEAVAAGKFHVYAVEHVDQGMELLTGMRMGVPYKHGGYPANTLNRKVAERLAALAERKQVLLAVAGGDGA